MEIQSRREQVSSRREQATATISDSDDLSSYELYTFHTRRTERNVDDGKSTSSSPPEEGQRVQKKAVDRRWSINFITPPQGVYPIYPLI